MHSTNRLGRSALLAFSLLAACSEEEVDPADGGPGGSFPDSSVMADGSFLPPVGMDAAVGGGTVADAGGPGAPDAQAPQPTDASMADASPNDASSDASAPDASAPDASAPDASTDAGPGPCNTPAPHGCYKPKAGNDPNCPAQMPEQSGYYPPLEEWRGCSSPLYQPCVYLRPDGTEANCSCDLGLHWLCVY